MVEQDAAAADSEEPGQPVLCIGEFRLDLNLRSLYRGDEKVKITALPFGTLEYLLRNRHRVVSKAELLENVWGGQRAKSAVEHVIGQLRQALGDTSDEKRYIETVPGQGYRLVAEVAAVQVVEAAHPAPIVEAAAAATTLQGRAPVPRQFRLGWVAFGLLAAAGAGLGARALVRQLRPPVVERVAINGRALTAFGAMGNSLWTRELDGPWAQRDPSEASWRTQIVDLNGDGAQEVLVAAPATTYDDELLCFSARGKVLWRCRAQIHARFGTWEVNGPWIFRHMLVASEKGLIAVYLAVSDAIWWQSFVLRISPSGAQSIVFVSSGNIRDLQKYEMASGSYILAAGINNEYGQASLAVLPQDGPPATSPQGDAATYLCSRGCPSARPYRYILLPRSELNIASQLPYNFAALIHKRTNGVTVETDELRSGPGSLVFYDFSQDLEPQRVVYGDGYREAHRQFERDGRIKHTYEQCPERKAPAILRICDENGNWSTVSVPRVP